MRTINEEVLEGYDLGKITKLILNKSIDGETIVEGKIIDFSDATVILSGVSNSGKGKELKETKVIKGKILVGLDKNNFNLITEANEEHKFKYASTGNKVEDLFKFIGIGDESYIVEI